MEQLLSLDEQLLLAINSCHNTYWDMFMYRISDKLVWIPFYATILYAIYKSYGWRTMLLIILMTALAIAAADQVSSHLIRPLTQRMRPSNLANPLSEFVHVVNGYRGGRYGFPSAHAANTFAVAMLTTGVFRRWRYTAFIFLWSALVCYSRMYLGVHYPGDILAGMTIGLLFGFVCYLLSSTLLNLYCRRHPDSAESEKMLASYRNGAPILHNKFMGNEIIWQPSDLPILIGTLTVVAIAIYSIF